ncbi:TonB-dependent receptor [Flavivirga aquimarina]|uniref:TonB-dependent receptor n=1 Tax=Flavivirga aquimarina TaxID=2027862 RepID=A0ABT8W567_9FLAO|nr:TonB-dependent receptor [Flavivirga aquimarina]MDO5968255.1 TonB-dependent receptor [Flavivirga aquimarina]
MVYKVNSSCKNYLKIFGCILLILPNLIQAQESVLDKKISISIDGIGIIETLQEIEKNENCFFSYNKSSINTTKKVTKTFNNTSLRLVLESLFEDYKMYFSEEGNVIYIRKDSRKGKVTGKVIDANNTPIPFASIILENTIYGTSSDKNGNYTFLAPQGNYVISVSTLGFESKKQEIKIIPDQPTQVNFTLNEEENALREILIEGKSISKKIAEAPIKINTIETKDFKLQSIGVAEILKTSPGVVVRRSGGLGSDVEVNLNGLTGNAVRVYIDGFPIEYLGGGFDLTNIPASNINRLEIYKGVVPTDKATDALGGGVNIVSKKIENDVLETSYEIGSFNTHRVSLLSGKKINDHITLSFDGFYNFSDNDFFMNNITNTTEETFTDQFTGEIRTQLVRETINNIRRFNNAHESYFAQVGMQIHDLSWADEITIKGNISHKFNEIQTLDITDGSAIEGYFGETKTFNTNLGYKKSFFDNKLKLDYRGVLSNALSTTIRDSLNVINWNREVIVKNGLNPIDTETEFTTNAHRLGISYKLNNQHKISINNFYARSKIFRRNFIDPFITINGEEINGNLIPSFFTKNISSAEISSNWFKKSLNTILFGKYYLYDANTVSQQSPTVLNLQVKDQLKGFGFALKYAFNTSFFIRTSYENAVRIPDEFEVYGNFTNIRSNFNLRPEQSDNINFGIDYEQRFLGSYKINLGFNGFIRNTKDLIALRGEDVFLQYQNFNSVLSQGVEFNVKITKDPFSNISFNLTNQERTYKGFNALSDNGLESFIGTSFPNTPFFFYNVLFNLGAKSFKETLPNIVLYGNWFHTKAFSNDDIPPNGEPEPLSLIPTQDEINMGIGYFSPNKKLSFSFQVNNITNDFQLFDNYRVPKPNRNYQFKINYKIF